MQQKDSKKIKGPDTLFTVSTMRKIQVFDATVKTPMVCLPQTCPSVCRRLMDSHMLPKRTGVCVVTASGHQGLSEDRMDVCVCV